MSRKPAVRLEVLLPLAAGGLGSLLLTLWFWVQVEAPQPQSSVESTRSAPNAELASTGAPVPERIEVTLRGAPTAPRQPDIEREDGEPFEPDPEQRTEEEFYEHFLAQQLEDALSLEARAEEILLGGGPDPEKVALLRVLHRRDSAASRELFLTAIRSLPDASGRSGESVPSFALLFLDRRAERDAAARAILRRAAFEQPGPGVGLRRRAAASFFLHATAQELLTARGSLAREQDALLREMALEALSRNAGSRVALDLLASYGRSPSSVLDEPAEGP